MSPRLRTLAAVGAAGAVYFVLACLIYWPATPLDANRLAGCACGDPEQQTWFLAWTSFALTHGHNPFLTSYLHAPMGANLAIDTSMPLLGALGIPITLTAGPVAAFNLLLRLGLAASGASLFGVLRRYTSWWPAAFGGGLLFMLSPYVANQGIRHLFLSFVPLVPLFIPILDDWLISRRRSAVRSGLLLGLVAALQYLISAEILLTSAIMAVVALAYLALRYRSGVRERLGALLRGAAAAIPAFLLIAGYAIWMLLAGPDRPKGAVHTLSGLARYHGDLLSPLYPTGHQLIAPAALAAIGNRLATGLTIEDGFYLGFPLVVLLGYLVIRCRRIPLVGVAVTVGVAAFILGLGSRLTVNGKTLSVPLPFAILQHLPVVQNLEAARFSLFIQLAAAIIFAVGLDRVRARGWLPASARAARHAISQGQPPGAQGTPEPQGIAAAQGAAAPPGTAPQPGAAPPQRDVPAPAGHGWVRPLMVGAVGLVALLPTPAAPPAAHRRQRHAGLLQQPERPRGAGRSRGADPPLRPGPAERRHDVAGGLRHALPHPGRRRVRAQAQRADHLALAARRAAGALAGPARGPVPEDASPAHDPCRDRRRPPADRHPARLRGAGRPGGAGRRRPGHGDQPRVAGPAVAAGPDGHMAERPA